MAPREYVLVGHHLFLCNALGTVSPRHDLGEEITQGSAHLCLFVFFRTRYDIPVRADGYDWCEKIELGANRGPEYVIKEVYMFLIPTGLAMKILALLAGAASILMGDQMLLDALLKLFAQLTAKAEQPTKVFWQSPDDNLAGLKGAIENEVLFGYSAHSLLDFIQPFHGASSAQILRWVTAWRYTI